MEQQQVVSRNRKAFHDYHIDETYEAGIVLTGTEVKSVRQSRVNLKDSYARVENGELFLYNMHIGVYDQGNRFNHDPLRKRKLLMHRAEINRLMGKVKEKGYALIPLKVYLVRGLVKVELALARGKKIYDKRRALAEKESRREMERALKEKLNN
ncbi:MAG TPA: SsrA-binding protein SmpB [Bacillota bacterium]|jgi:SsrA-binding protein|nr:SsrA-binding protein SmpB [Bacillota bacterium]HOB86203.1 SsrA-binding protein SmpB [Bacillota bacterium]HOP68140.1 SsrA-binding protein SmpB [Bacillota bacterium]HPT33010.1 SsrA-binding protein SmpB [Bacillota bacterium]HPZ64131.1 SsrA-binding protein SmpB [Bacillota bacterium]